MFLQQNYNYLQGSEMHNFSNTTKYIDNSLINSQSLEDMQVK